MKTLQKSFILLVYILAIPCHGQPNDGTHSYEVSYDNFPIHASYTFRNTPSDMKFIQSFPRKELLDNPMVESIEKVETIHDIYFNLTMINSKSEKEVLEIQYYVFPTIRDAEFVTIRKFYNNPVLWRNALGTERDDDIGDNCWYNSTDTEVIFIRNNIWVYISEKEVFNNSNEYFEAIELAVLIDSLLVVSTVEPEPNRSQAPVITSVITDKVGTVSPYAYFLSVKASDPQGQKLTYRALWAPPSTNSNDGSIICFKGMIPMSFDRSYMRLLVWDEDNIVTGYDYHF